MYIDTININFVIHMHEKYFMLTCITILVLLVTYARICSFIGHFDLNYKLC